MLFYLLPLYHKVLRQDSERPINAVLTPGIKIPGYGGTKPLRGSRL